MAHSPCKRKAGPSLGPSEAWRAEDKKFSSGNLEGFRSKSCKDSYLLVCYCSDHLFNLRSIMLVYAFRLHQMLPEHMSIREAVYHLICHPIRWGPPGGSLINLSCFEKKIGLQMKPTAATAVSTVSTPHFPLFLGLKAACSLNGRPVTLSYLIPFTLRSMRESSLAVSAHQISFLCNRVCFGEVLTPF